MNARRSLDPQELLAHAAGVRALARALVGDSANADDVVQETWRVAIEQGVPPDAPLGAWLAAIVRKLARTLARGETRRRAREWAGARAEALPSAAELCERAAVHRELVEAVLALDEPYRRALLLRYFEGLPPRAIADRERLSLDAVKSRLARGLAELRRRMRLDDESTLNTWTALFGARVAPATPPLLIGVAVKSIALPVLVAVCAVVTAVWYVRRAEDAPEVRSHSTAVLQPDAPSSAEMAPLREASPLTADSSGATPERGASAATDPAEDGAISGRVVDERGRALAGARIRVALDRRDAGFGMDAAAARGGRAPVADLLSDASGAFRWPVDPLRDYEVRVEAAGYGTRQFMDRRGSEFLLVRLGPACRIEGRVVRAEDSAAVANAEVAVYLADDVYEPFEARSQSDGTFAIDSLPSGCARLWVRASGHIPCVRRRIELGPEPAAPIVVSLEGGVTLRGRVLDGLSGQPIAGAQVADNWPMRCATTTDEAGRYALAGLDPAQGNVLIWTEAAGYAGTRYGFQTHDGPPTDAELSLLPATRRARGRVMGLDGWPKAGVAVAVFGDIQRRTTTTDAEGCFVIDGLSPEARHVLAVRSPGCAHLVFDFPEAELERDVDFGDVTLRAPSNLRGSVVDADGHPVAEATIELFGCNADRAAFASEAVHGHEFGFARRETRSDSRGSFAYTDIARGSYEVVASQRGRAQSARTFLYIAAESANEAALAFSSGPTLHGRVVDARGAPLVRVRVHAWSEPYDGTRIGSTLTSPGGEFALHGLPAGTCVLEVELEDPWDAREIAPKRLERVPTDSVDVVLVVPEPAYVAGVVVGPDDHPFAYAGVSIDHHDGWSGGISDSVRSDREGRFRLRVADGEPVDLKALVWASNEVRYVLIGTLAGVEPGAADLVIRMRAP